MHKLLGLICACLAVVALSPREAAAQSLTNCDTASERRELITGDDYLLIGNVEMICDDDTEVYAEEIRLFTKEQRAVATGNVVFAQGRNRIAASRAEFNTETRYGTFYDATGFASMEGDDDSLPMQTIAGQETDVFFFGETVERIGERRYRITKGGFTTCVQPTPRWELHAGTVILNIDDYTLLRGVVFRVKNVPLLYVPIIYYPTKDEDRATGILLPSYGSSTVMGQTISNAFFWAISRSQDATLTHEWYSKAGQGFGGEYRYNLGAGSEGTLNATMLKQVVGSEGGFTEGDAREYRLEGRFNQRLPAGFRARGSINYFTSLTQQLISQSDITRASNGQRRIGANVVGAWRSFSLNADAQYYENFRDLTTSNVSGGMPRVAISQNERPLFRNAPVYVSFGSEFARIQNEARSRDGVRDLSLTRFDVSPEVRVPFNRWQWLTVNSSVSWRDTYYTRSLDPDEQDPAIGGPLILDESLNRNYFTFQSDIVGPAFNRIWDTPNSGYAERIKHSVEPFVRVQRTTATEDFERVIQYDGIDRAIGGTTKFEYGIENRIYAKRPIGGRASVAREILRIGLRQTYYTDSRQAQNDFDYHTGVGSEESRYSPIALDVRATPTDNWNATLRAELDSRYRELRTLTAKASFEVSDSIEASGGWVQRFFVENLDGFDNPSRVTRNMRAAIS
ncbi:MAG: LPS-assembly protein LptD, partial [Vicinamibacterales bacterium]